MARPLRIEFADAVCHVTARGNRQEPIFVDDNDRRLFLDLPAQAFDRFDASALAYCMMGNHYHLVLRTRQPNLSALMRHVNGVFAHSVNRRHGKVGHGSRSIWATRRSSNACRPTPPPRAWPHPKCQGHSAPSQWRLLCARGWRDAVRGKRRCTAPTAKAA